MRIIYVLFLVVLLAGTGSVAPLAQSESWPGDRFMGAADATVTVIEYASLTCPHCASFHNDTLPRLKQAYIDTGKVKLIYRDFPIDGLALRAAMLARCSEPAQYFGKIEVLYRNQEAWSRVSDPIAALHRIGRLAGMSDQKIDACLNDREAGDTILGARLRASKEHDVNTTPTFIINGQKITGAQPFEEFDKILRKLVPAS